MIPDRRAATFTPAWVGGDRALTVLESTNSRTYTMHFRGGVMRALQILGWQRLVRSWLLQLSLGMYIAVGLGSMVTTSQCSEVKVKDFGKTADGKAVKEF